MSQSIPPYILQELPDIFETVNYPIRNIHRIKYTCFNVSKSLLAFGATSGGIYVFNRLPCEFVQLIPSKDGPITRLSISPDEQYISFTNGKGMVTVTRCDQNLSGYSSHMKHHGNEVTCMVWSNTMLFTGDDVGKVCVLQLQNFIAKTMFQSSSQIIMNLDSRICQIDAKGCMLLVSTLTRCYICNTIQEQYRQIGQKLRDGEYGACFVTMEKIITNGTSEDKHENFIEAKKYNIVDDDVGFVVGEEFSNTVIYCARPSSRLWEATVDGMVRRTHQFKQVLSNNPSKVITKELYDRQKFVLNDTNDHTNGQSVNFTKIYNFNKTIFSYSKSALYFLNVERVDETIWFDEYKDIIECSVYDDILYIWRANGCLVSLRLMEVDRFLVKSYFDEKYVLCSELCMAFKEYLLTRNLSPKIHNLVGLKDKIDNGVIKSLEDVLEKFNSLKTSDATKTKSGIFVVDNTYQNMLDDRKTKVSEESVFGPVSPEAMQALKELSITVSDKLSTSKKIIKEKWGGFEERMKHLSIEKHEASPIRNENVTKWVSRDDYEGEDAPIVLENNIVFKESSPTVRENTIVDEFEVCKMLYQYSRLSVVIESSDLNSIIDNNTCNMKEVHDLMLLLQKYCMSINAIEESKFVPNNIFLTYLNTSSSKCDLLDVIINDEVLYKYFVDSCIAVNIKMQKHLSLGCECGFPLPYVRTSQMPVFSDLIDQFIEIQWSSQTKEQCYEVCKKMPYLWRKILYLRRNEDLINVLRILLQMLDEGLLHSFLPQFTLDTWERTIQLYATLYGNICLNCNKKFNHVSVKDMLSWDYLGSLMIKSIGGRKAIQVMQKYANLIEMGALTMRFYHTCLLVSLYEKIDVTINITLVDTIYSSYDFKESRVEIHKLLQNTSEGVIKNTALPLTVAATSPCWGLKKVYENISNESDSVINDISMAMTNNNIIDCDLCGLPLQNEVLIQDGGLWVFKCGHTFHGACLNLNQIKLCPSCSIN
ncbi:BLOC-2 complex member HPS5 homolog isoform X1 [Danaus plexippus]|uniref:BLOC-2 complex member HPS5 homolog isoform X1 n=1 Tax=Danaus plexippus TaxID=13037 RepID=UPI002AB28B04|nr:BLOC-2 complex member HPS5 homolog isoform X1 [Danaus plexippus]